MPKVISATEARIRFGELMRLAVEKGEVVIVARGDKPYVAILPFSEYKRLREREKERGWEESLKRILAVGAAIKAARKGKLLPPPENVIVEMRKERDEHLTRLR